MPCVRISRRAIGMLAPQVPNLREPPSFSTGKIHTPGCNALDEVKGLHAPDSTETT